MGFIATDQNITVKLTAGQSAVFSDEWYTYRYYRIVISGNPDGTATEITLNGTTSTYGGIVTAPDSIIMDVPIWECTVVSGQAVLFGVKSVKKIFGDNAHPYNVEFPPYN